MNSHEHYEELCALAVTGQVSQPELMALKAHLEDCPDCRALSDDLLLLSSQGLLILGAERSHAPIPFGMTERFVARARSEGIGMSRGAATAMAKRHRVSIPVLSATAAAVLIVAIFAGWKSHYSSFKATDQHRMQVSVPDASRASILPSPSVHPTDGEATQRLATAQSEMSVLNATIRSQRDEIEALRQAKEALSSQLAETEKQNTSLQSEKSERELRVAHLQAELEKSQSDKTTSDVSLALQETELRELRKKVDDAAAQLRQQEELTARGSDVRDLVVARNLHIIDVHEWNGDGKSQRAFGRIFYTEGKSLIFYAYDLADAQKVDAKVSFCVWGERLGAGKPIKSLGVLHNDDASDGRWVLTFDDRQVLAQIDSVFVTVESSRKSIRQPGGKRILLGFLGEKPNHP